MWGPPSQAGTVLGPSPSQINSSFRTESAEFASPRVACQPKKQPSFRAHLLREESLFDPCVLLRPSTPARSSLVLLCCCALSIFQSFNLSLSCSPLPKNHGRSSLPPRPSTIALRNHSLFFLHTRNVVHDPLGPSIDVRPAIPIADAVLIRRHVHHVRLGGPRR
jgi:hypothetical protein